MTIKNNAEPANPHAQGIPKGQNATSYAAPTLEKQQKYDMRGPNSASQVTNMVYTYVMTLRDMT